jgi:oligopeptide transport system substrate-binding protein
MRRLAVSERETSTDQSPDARALTPTQLLAARATRRRVLGSLTLSVGAVAAGTLLAACGGSDDKATATKAAAGQTPATGSTTASGGGSPTAGGAAPTSTTATGAATTPSGGSPTSGGRELTPVSELADEQTIVLPGGEPVTMDPGVSYGDNELDFLFNIFDGLTGVDMRTGEVVPRVAEKYEANADATEYTFHLRSGLKWSDGTAMNANDFVYSWQRVLDPNTKSQYMPALYPIKNGEEAANGDVAPTELGIKASDENTLTVTLVGSTPYFPLLTTTWTFFPVPKHVIDEAGDEWVEAENIVSNGPYIMKEWKHDQTIMLEQNPNFYGDKPSITKAEYRIFADETTQAFVAYENDEVDYAPLADADIERVMGDSDLSKELLAFSLSNCYFVVCDTTNTPTDKVEFRQALSMSIARQTLTDQVLKKFYDPAYTILAPDIPGNNPDAALGEDVAKAKDLLTQAGITDPGSTKIELVYISTPERNKTIAEYLQATWNKNLGITVTLTPIENSAYSDWRASRETQPFNTYTGSWGSDFGDPSNWINQNFTSTADHYRNHWKNDEFDQLAAKAAVNTDPASRAQQYQDAEKILVSDAPIIPLYRVKAFRMVKPYVKNLFLQPILSVVHLRTIQIEKH